MLQNEFKSDVARFTTRVQTCQQPDLLQDRFYLGGKTRNVALQLVLLQFCKTNMHVFCRPFFRTLRAPSFQTKTSGLNFWQLPVANGTALSKISQKEDNLARHTKILETFVPLFPSFRKFWLNAGKRSKD